MGLVNSLSEVKMDLPFLDLVCGTLVFVQNIIFTS